MINSDTIVEIISYIDSLPRERAKFIYVTGCGGKTSLIRFLALHYAETKRVTVAASAKMLLPDETWMDLSSRKSQAPFMLCREDADFEASLHSLKERRQGVCFMADEIVGGRKMAGFSKSLQDLAGEYSDIILVEADGSRGIPLKGWEQYEPVLSDRADLVIAVLPLHVLGKSVCDETVFRMDRFSEATGQESGSLITAETYVRLASAFPGPFGNTESRKDDPEKRSFCRLLFLNRCGNTQEEEAAQYISAALGDRVDKVIYGELILHESYISEKMKDEEFLENTTAVIPASGFSKRMGREKLLLPFRGKSILANVLEAVCSFSWKSVIVCAAQEDVINEARKKADVHVLYNPDPSAGQSRSIILAVEESAQSAGWIFTSADMPLLSKEIIRRLREAIASHPDQIVQVRYQGLPGQPVYFPGKYREELLHLTGDTGGRQIIHRHLEDVVYVEIQDPLPGIDIDTPEDYEKLSGKER